MSSSVSPKLNYFNIKKQNCTWWSTLQIFQILSVLLSWMKTNMIGLKQFIKKTTSFKNWTQQPIILFDAGTWNKGNQFAQSLSIEIWHHKVLHHFAFATRDPTTIWSWLQEGIVNNLQNHIKPRCGRCNGCQIWVSTSICIFMALQESVKEKTCFVCQQMHTTLWYTKNHVLMHHWLLSKSWLEDDFYGKWIIVISITQHKGTSPLPWWNEQDIASIFIWYKKITLEKKPNKLPYT